MVYQAQGKYDGAETLFKEVLAGQTAKLGADHPYTLTSKDNLAGLYRHQGKYDLAETLFKEVLEVWTARLGADHLDTLISKNNLAAHYWDQGQCDRAEPLFREAVAGLRQKLGLANPNTRTILHNLIDCYEKMGQVAQAEHLLRELADFWKLKTGAHSPQYAGRLAALALNLLSQAKGTEAEGVLRTCLAIRQQKQADVWSTFNTKSMLGGALLLQKHFAEAEPFLLQGYEGMKQREATIPPPGRPRLTDALQRLVQLYDAWGRKEEATKWTTRLQGAKRAEELWKDLQASSPGTQRRFTETRLEGELAAKAPQQMHPLTLQAGKTYLLDLESKAFDPFLILEDEEGSKLAENDDISPTNLNARVIYSPELSGTYRVIATSYQQRGTGPYVLRIRELVQESDKLGR
jgi:tetratricopeptide (TPR) repeat protein